MPKLTSAETIRFVRLLETVLKDVLGVADVQIVIDVENLDQVWGDDDASLLEATGQSRSKDRPA